MSSVAIRKVQRFGWRRSLPDFRDFKLGDVLQRPIVLPSKIDLSAKCAPVMDQGDLGSCVAHGVTAAIRFARMKQGQQDQVLSRLQLYYDARKVEGTVNEDSGVETRDAIKCAAKSGVAPEKDWPYDPTKFSQAPPALCYSDGLANQALQYHAVALNVLAIKTALAAGLPVVIGISVYDSFDSDEVARTGSIPLPNGTEAMLGGHCMYLHGYGNHSPDYAEGRNSWGTSWGRKGDFSIPWAYLTNPNLASDFWTIQRIG